MSEADEGRSDDSEILIIGAGPTGLAMACALRTFGVPCRIVDQGDGPTPEHQSRALGVQARTLEALQRLGIAEALVGEGRAIRGADLYVGRRRRARLTLEALEPETGYPFVLSVPQGVTERRMLERLEALGGRIDWRTGLTGLTAQDHGVVAKLEREDGSVCERRADWLIGCDGPRSVVRSSLGLSFTGSTYEERFLLADLRLKTELEPDRAGILIGPEGLSAAIPLPEAGFWRLIDATGGAEAETPESIRQRFVDLLRASAPGAIEVRGAVWTSAFHIHRRVVDHYRIGRCFLVGDAAHVHSPVGGQGMNTGIQDAVNLAWRLAEVRRGRAPEAFLDGYERERRPVALAVLEGTDRATRLVTLRNPLIRGLRDACAPWVFRLPWVRRQIARAIAELSVSYRDDSRPIETDWSVDPAASIWDPPGPRPGERLPNPPVSDGRLHDVALGPWYSALLFTGIDRLTRSQLERFRATVEHGVQHGAAELTLTVIEGRGPLSFPEDGETRGISAARNAPSYVSDPEGRLHRAFGTRVPALYLVRPDLVIARRVRPPSPDGLPNLPPLD